MQQFFTDFVEHFFLQYYLLGIHTISTTITICDRRFNYKLYAKILFGAKD